LPSLASEPCPDTIIVARTAGGPSRSGCPCRNTRRPRNPSARAVARRMRSGASLPLGFLSALGEDPGVLEVDSPVAGAAAIQAFREPIDPAARFGRVRRPGVRPEKCRERASGRAGPLSLGGRSASGEGRAAFFPARVSYIPLPSSTPNSKASISWQSRNSSIICTAFPRSSHPNGRS